MTSNMDSPSTPASPRYLLVMTATVTPAANAQVKRSSPRVRLEDYKRALRFWLGYAHAAAERILFLENSGADLSPLRGIAENENPRRREVEFLSLPTLEIPAGMNYGYTEMQTLDEGLALSKLRPATTHMIKATGRLTFPALGKALDRVTKFGHNEAAPLEAHDRLPQAWISTPRARRKRATLRLFPRLLRSRAARLESRDEFE